MAPFVLVHGGRHGGWCWRRVATRLRDAGHEVYAPTLTGSGERAHLLTPQVGLDTHVRDLVAIFEYEDITGAVLVAHSYGGMVACGAMEKVADRVRSLVLLDAHLPRKGESVFDLNGPERAGAMIALADESGEGWYIPPADARRYGVTDPADRAWVNARMTAQPLKTYQDPSGPTDRAWSHPACSSNASLRRSSPRRWSVPGRAAPPIRASVTACCTPPTTRWSPRRTS